MKFLKKITIFYFSIISFTYLSFGLPLSIEYNSKNIRLGEMVSLEVESSDNASITWKIGDKVYSSNNLFYFYPDAVGNYRVKVLKNQIEEDSIDITVTSFPTLPCNNTTITATGLDGQSKIFICNIQKALEFVQSHNGGVVHLSRGIYPINQQLVIYDNSILQGTMDGNKSLTTIRLADNVRWSDRGRAGSWVAVPPLIVNDANIAKSQSLLREPLAISNYNVTIKNITIDGNRENQIRKWHLGEGHYTLLDFRDIRDLNISNVTLYRGLSDGIFIKTGSNIHISNSNIKDMGHSAIFQVEVHNVTVKNNTIAVNVNSGIRFFGGSDFSIKDNFIYSTSGYGNYGIQVSQAYSIGIPMKNVVIENNIIYKTPYAGIALYASKKRDIAEATIKNNIIVGCGSKAPNMDAFPDSKVEESGGINIQSFKNITVMNNTLFNNYGSGIWLDNRFYNSDVNFDEIESIKKEAKITNNIIVGSLSSQKNVYAIEKYHNPNSAGTELNISNNIFYNNQNGSYSSNILLNRGNFFNKNPQFLDAINIDLRLQEGSIALDINGDVVIGASQEMLERNKNTSLPN
jgi:parallel beta-helix repeat protein